MEEILLEKLQEIYNLEIEIEIEFIDFRRYAIFCKLNPNKFIRFLFEFDCKYTIDFNVQILSDMIDRQIVKLYKKGEYK